MNKGALLKRPEYLQKAGPPAARIFEGGRQSPDQVSRIPVSTKLSSAVNRRRTGQILNKTDSAALVVSLPTITGWIGILGTTGQILLAPPAKIPTS